MPTSQFIYADITDNQMIGHSFFLVSKLVVLIHVLNFHTSISLISPNSLLRMMTFQLGHLVSSWSQLFVTKFSIFGCFSCFFTLFMTQCFYTEFISLAVSGFHFIQQRPFLFIFRGTSPFLPFLVVLLYGLKCNSSETDGRRLG